MSVNSKRPLRAALSCVALSLGTAVAADSPLNSSDLFLTLSPETSAPDLNAYRWDNRLVLLFGAGLDDPQFTAARLALEKAEGALRDRDILVLMDAHPEAAGKLRQGLDVDGFAMVLVGKDGGVKVNSDQIVQPEALFDTIDAMPMRKREMG